MTLAAEELKSCCAAAYATPAARWLLGESFHPGGAELTSQLAARLQVGSGKTVVDVGSGPGTSALQLARETGCDVVGVDLSPESVAGARQLAAEAGLDGNVRFLRGDAEALPLDDDSVDGALCECSLCTFPDKAAAASELARVLRPSARLALSDMTAVPEELPPALASLEAWVACLGGARPLEETAELLEGAAFELEAVERCDHVLGELIDRVEARLRTARFFVGDTVSRGLELTSAARDALRAGTLGYGVIVARRL
jgi:arsenite methyltransferase